MIIEKLSLKNFKLFEDVSLEFATSKEKNVTIIYGEMGAGKSGLFQAVNWCLYGSNVQDKDVLPKGTQIANKRLLYKLKDGEIGEVTAELVFSDNYKRYVAIRTAKYKKIEKTLNPVSEDFWITISTPSGKPELVKGHECQRYINMVLPPTVREYFLFDGEKIDKFSKIGQENEIKDSINQVLGFSSLDLAKNLFDRARKRYKDESYGIEDSNIASGIQLIEEFEQELEDYKHKQKELKIEFGLADEEFSDIEEKLDKYQDRKVLLEDRKRSESQLKRVDSEIVKIKEGLKSDLSKSGLIIGKKAFKEASSIIDDLRQKKQIPSEYNETLITDIINERTCICGRKVEKGSEEYENLKKLLEELPFSLDLQNQIISLFGEINKVESTSESAFYSIRNNVGRIVELRDELNQYNLALEEVNEKLGDFSDVDFNELEERRKEIIDKKYSLKSSLAVNVDRIEQSKQNIEFATKDLKKLKSKNAKEKEIKDKIILINSSKKAIDDLYNVYTEDKRKLINEKCKNIFKNLVWKSSHFKDVELNEEYELNVLDRFNTPARPDLSAGERQLLSLAFITAMAESANKEAPFILDTPFARISKVPRENIAYHLPSLVTQLILLVTDVELTPESERMFNQKAGKIYTLIFDDYLGISKIEVGKHVE